MQHQDVRVEGVQMNILRPLHKQDMINFAHSEGNRSIIEFLSVKQKKKAISHGDIGLVKKSDI